MERWLLTRTLGADARGSVYEGWDSRLQLPVVVKRYRDPVRARRELAMIHEARDCDPALVVSSATDRLHEDCELRFGELANDFEAQPHPAALVLRHAGATAVLNVALGAGDAGDARLRDAALPVFRCVAELHSRSRLVHPDVKPANVVRHPNGTCTLVNLALAALPGTENRIMGTPLYMPPEGLRGAVADRSADVWSLGVVLYQMACGASHPFLSVEPAAMETRDTFLRACNGLGYTDAMWLNAGSPLAADLVRLMLNSDPEERPDLLDVMRHPFVRGINHRRPGSVEM
jgi:hypothetical protein